MDRDLVTDIFFDLDHTLWDFEKNSRLTFERILRQHGINVDLSKFLEVYVPINLSYWKLYREEKIEKTELRYLRLKNTFDRLGHPILDDTIHLLSEDYIFHLSSFNNLFPHAVEILEYLNPKYNLHIITNGFQEIQEKKLRNANILHFFDQIVNSEDAGVKKPNPWIFELALKKANVAVENALMIGDSLEADIMGARAVGFQTLHFNAHNEPEHEYGTMISHLSEIKTYL